MARQRKTRQQKIIAGLRRKVSTTEAKSPSSHTYLSQIIPSIPKAAKHMEYPDYTYVLQDLRKTGILTFAIICTQIFLFFLLKNRIISLPGFS